MKTKPSPTAHLMEALTENGFSHDQTYRVYSKQLPHRGDHWTYTFLANGRVQIRQTCWLIKDGWSQSTISVKEALREKEGFGS